MIKITCDKCDGKIEQNELIGRIRWSLKEGIDGEYTDDELEGKVFCERCMDAILSEIQRKITWESVEEPKDNKRTRITEDVADKIIELYHNGMSYRAIGQEVGLPGNKVASWCYYKMKHGGL